MTLLTVSLAAGTLFALLILCNGEDVHIETRLGPVVGIKKDDAMVSVFYNIPFAKPPLGSLRFAKPVPYGNWTGTLNATTPGKRCMQVTYFQSFEISEDCLQLNIYVPNSVNISSTVRTPVMVFIHGGGFTAGGADMYDSSELSRQGGVIVVTIQYRLGIFGFFSLGNEEASGNYGLWDQMLALKWVNQNIGSFGGNAGAVTVFGQSAGGISVSFLSLIPENKNVFHRVIVQSGNLFVSNSTQASYDIGELLGCSNNIGTTAFVGCLRNKDPNTILTTSSTYTFTSSSTSDLSAGLPFAPNVDGELLKKTPESLLNDFSSEEYNFFSSLDIMTGTMKTDGNIFLLSLSESIQNALGINLTAGVSTEEFCNTLIPAIINVPYDNNTLVSKRLCEEYRVPNNVSEQSRQMLQFVTDYFFAHPAFGSLRAHSSQNLVSNTYQYVFELEAGWSALLQRPPVWYIGPGHGDELFYLFPSILLTELQKNVSASIIKYWTNFAKSGNPNHPALPHWPSYNHADQSYLSFGEVIEPGMKYKTKRMKLWDEEIPQILEQSYPIVNTLSGRIKGINKQMGEEPNKGSVSAFYNIPYAAPPIGELRFSKPKPFGNWSGTRDATQYGPECMQAEVSTFPKSEDCLQLNVFVPGVPSPSSKKTVMVWIHGGGFLLGSSLIYDGSDIAHQGDVIVVTINYRLGIFGFLSLNDPIGKGNYGLWDQIFALQWVQQNIAAFGGDPSSVTIFGESAGGFSVSLLSLIPSNRGLFHRVISQSGVAASRWAFGSSEPATRSVGDMLGCSRQLSSQLYIDCLRNVNATTLNDYTIAYLQRDPSTIRQLLEFTPYIDEELFHNTPAKILSNSSLPEHEFLMSLELISGTVRTEGSELAGVISQPAVQEKFNINITAGISTEFMCDNFTKTLVSDFFDGNNRVKELICEKYTVQNNMTEQGRRMLDIFTDFLFVAPSFVQLQSHSLQNVRSKSFQYVLERQRVTFDWTLSYYPPWYRPPGHTEDLYYLFPQSFGLTSPVDLQYSKVMMSYWTNFAKYGNPNNPTLPHWPSYNHADQGYLNFGEVIEPGMKYKMNSIKLWDEEIPQILEQSYPIVNTLSGRIKGINKQIGEEPNKGSVSAFYNIPYAAPPIRELRFSKPKPFGNWSGTRDATQYGPECMQAELTPFSKSEDCLQLNVFVPGVPSPSSKKSVMVWIHGGGYLAGSALIYDGSGMAHQGDVIVVTINYRLGIFGFLSLNDPVGKGNYGLWDQILALQWVQRNIAAFGGDSSSVTIFGESAGGFSVSLLSLIPSNRDLFHRVISQSGVAASRWAFGSSEPATRSVGDMLGCSRQLSSQLYIDCLRNVNATTLNDYTIAYLQRDPSTIRQLLEFTPYIDEELFHNTPAKILSNSSLPEHEFLMSLDLICGTVRTEGSLLAGVINQPAVQEKFNINATAGVPTAFMCDNFTKTLVSDFFDGNNRVKELICEKYTIQNNMTEQGRRMLDIFTDFLFVAPSFVQLQSHSLQNVRSKSFQFVLERKKVTLDGTLSYYPPWYDPPGHAEDLYYLFPQSLGLTSPVDIQYSKIVMSYWTNFAKYGDPNEPSLPFWPTYDASKQAHLVFGDNITARVKYEEDRVKTWVEDIPRIMMDANYSDVEVQTPLGNIRGVKRDVLHTSPNDKVYVFYGIPFAKPPVGGLRFAKPQPYGTFNGTFDATKMGSACVQPPVFPDIKHYSEDCLQLNIYVPNNISTSNRKSVMVWIHGGGYALGSAIQTDGSILATKGDVIVVTVNYRLGVFGFFSLNNDASRGNYGIWDQILALKWIKDNIMSFGGNSDSITIFGESAGGFSVSLLSLIPQNQGLFHRVIAQSGTALGPLAFGDSRPATIGIGNLSQCDYNDSDNFIKCMRNKTVEEVSIHYLTFVSRNTKQLAPVIDFMPNVDNELFYQTPTEIIRNMSSKEFQFFASLDLMSGVMRQEGSIVFEILNAEIQKKYNFDLAAGIPTVFVCNHFIPAFLDYIHIPGNQQLIKWAACDKYRDTRSEAKQATYAFDFAADLLFTIPLVKVLDAHSTNNVHTRTFQYLVTEEYPYPYYALPGWYEGPSHADDVGFIFQFFIPPTNNIKNYLAVSDKMIAYWSNFAKEGDPNDNSLERWPVYNNQTRGYIILDSRTKSDLKYADSRVKFWLEELPDRLAYKPTTTPINPYVKDRAATLEQRPEYFGLFVFLQCLIVLMI